MTSSSNISQTCDNLLPLLNHGTQLKDLVGPNSMVMFNRLKVEPTFLITPPKQWVQNANYNSIKTMLQNIQVVNDSAECALGLVTSYNDQTITKVKSKNNTSTRSFTTLGSNKTSLSKRKHQRATAKKIWPRCNGSSNTYWNVYHNIGMFIIYCLCIIWDCVLKRRPSYCSYLLQ